MYLWSRAFSALIRLIIRLTESLSGSSMTLPTLELVSNTTAAGPILPVTVELSSENTMYTTGVRKMKDVNASYLYSSTWYHMNT